MKTDEFKKRTCLMAKLLGAEFSFTLSDDWGPDAALTFNRAYNRYIHIRLLEKKVKGESKEYFQVFCENIKIHFESGVEITYRTIMDPKVKDINITVNKSDSKIVLEIQRRIIKSAEVFWTDIENDIDRRSMLFEQIKWKPEHIVSWSGGKDSTAMVIRMLELGMPVDRIIFAETGMEFPQMYKFHALFRVWLKNHYPGLITETVHTTASWDDWFYGKITCSKKNETKDIAGQVRGWPAIVGGGCWWTRESKFKPFQVSCNRNYSYIGYAADESSRLAGGVGPDKRGYKYPLADSDWDWAEKKCLEYLEEKKFQFNFIETLSELVVIYAHTRVVNLLKQYVVNILNSLPKC